MAVDQFYEKSLQRKLDELQARRLQLQTNLTISKRDGDFEDAADEIAQIAALDDQVNSVVRLYQRTVAETSPQRPPEETPEQKRVKPLKDWRDAAAICGVTEEQYAKGYHQAKEAGKLGEFHRSEDKG
jgi:hypothetical protein